MGDGSHQPIGEVRVCDQVMAFNPGDGVQSVETVTATWPHMDTVVTLTLGDSTVVETTASHPWWVASERAYVRTDHLEAGDQVLTADGSTLTVHSVSDPRGEQLVYNLSVTGPHTYYVSQTNILVHNKGKGEVVILTGNCDPKAPYEEQLGDAQALRNELSDRLANESNKPGAVTAGWDSQGNIVAACSGGGQCAESNVADALGVPKDEIQFTPAWSPGVNAEKPICRTCQSNFSRDQFPASVLFDKGPWSQ